MSLGVQSRDDTPGTNALIHDYQHFRVVTPIAKAGLQDS